jgi:hypothetical protein
MLSSPLLVALRSVLPDIILLIDPGALLVSITPPSKLSSVLAALVSFPKANSAAYIMLKNRYEHRAAANSQVHKVLASSLSYYAKTAHRNVRKPNIISPRYVTKS